MLLVAVQLSLPPVGLGLLLAILQAPALPAAWRRVGFWGCATRFASGAKCPGEGLGEFEYLCALSIIPVYKLPIQRLLKWLPLTVNVQKVCVRGDAP